MSESELTGATKRLLESAKGDGPSAARRARVWDGVATTAKVGAAGSLSLMGAATNGAGVAGVAAATSSAKGVVITAILGGVVTIGLAVALLVARTPTHGATAQLRDEATQASGTAVAANASANANANASASSGAAAPGSMARAAKEVVGSDAPREAGGDDTARQTACPPAPAAPSAAPAAPSAARRATGPQVPTASPPRAAAADSDDNGLMHEAMLVAEARGALVRGDADGALARVRAAARLPRRSLEPEELSLEAQSLRALGRVAEAEAAEGSLRQRFPFHALAR